MSRRRLWFRCLWLHLSAAGIAAALSLSPGATLVGRRVLVVGGSGRVGGAVATALARRGAAVVVGGTDADRFAAARDRWRRLYPDLEEPLAAVGFAALDRERAESVDRVLREGRAGGGDGSGFDLVVHTAGPFQGKAATPNGVLEACVALNTPYIDVCDDFCTASAYKTRYGARARAPCVVSTGCWPGVSSLMAAQLIRSVRKSHPELTPEDLDVEFSFFTAGSGGAGVTLLVATFLILAEKALAIKNGRRVVVDAMRDFSPVDFGPLVGARSVAPLNLLETASVHDTLGAGSVRSRFGTAPAVWNALLGLMARLPPAILADEVLMRRLSVFSLPIVRLVDALAGATNAMRCDVTAPAAAPALRATAIYGHENLEPCVGECVAAFAGAVLGGAVPAGVWFPEEAIRAGDEAAQVLASASVGAHTTLVEGTDIAIDKKEIWGRE